MKFLQYQINLNSLFTNYRVNKFKNHISPNYTFCQYEVTHPELVSHLFYQCTFVLKLWTDVKDWLSTANIDISLDSKVFFLDLKII